MMIANTVRNGASWHYGGADLIQGPGAWGETPERIARLERGQAQRLRLQSSSGEAAHQFAQLRVSALVSPVGVVLQARCSDFKDGAELAHTAEVQLIGKHVDPVFLDGRPILAWREVVVELPR
jgi:hypothetical protein